MNRRDALRSLLTLPAVGSVSVAQPDYGGVYTYAGNGVWIKLPKGMELTILGEQHDHTRVVTLQRAEG